MDLVENKNRTKKTKAVEQTENQVEEPRQNTHRHIRQVEKEREREREMELRNEDLCSGRLSVWMENEEAVMETRCTGRSCVWFRTVFICCT